MNNSCYYNDRDWREDYEKVFNHSIGQGTFGKVSLVRSRTTKAQYAMKEIDLRQHILKSSLINRSYALDEGLKLIKLEMKHENIISYHKAYIHDEHIYWIMDYCDGGTLRERISLYVKQNRFIEENLIWYWSLQILQGIKYIHSKGLVHRDLKPDNVYIHGKRGLCKIGDFGFAKLVVDSSMTQNTTTIKHFPTTTTTTTTSDERSISAVAEERRIAYKLINMSQVGTPSYIAPELRMLIDSHLNFSSVETINEKIKLCEKFIYKGDIFSFGCILYELTFLRLAFENRFQLPNDVYRKTAIELDIDESYSSDLRNLIKVCLEVNPAKRPNIKQVMQMSQVESRVKLDFEQYYKKQVTPSLIMSSKKNVLLCKSVTLETGYKPRAMKSLKFNQNLIVILAIKMSDTPDEESKLFIFNEFGELLNQFNSYLNEQSRYRKPFSFHAYDMCVDEEYNHLYLSTRKYGIMRFRIVDTNYYFEDLTLDGCLDLSELYACRQPFQQQQQQQQFELFPTCLTLVEDDSVFKDNVKTSKQRRRLIFYDRTSKQIVSIQTDLTSNRQHLINGMQHPSIKCDIYAGLTLDQTFPVRQMVSTSDELICLFDDLNVINVYNLKTLLIARTNQQQPSGSGVGGNGSSRATSESLRKNIMCLTLDSNGSLYSTNGKSICNLDYGDFKQKKRVSPFVKKGENLAHTISWITILTNSKLVLLTDALQMESSILFILNPVNSKYYDGV